MRCTLKNETFSYIRLTTHYTPLWETRARIFSTDMHAPSLASGLRGLLMCFPCRHRTSTRVQPRLSPQMWRVLSMYCHVVLLHGFSALAWWGSAPPTNQPTTKWHVILTALFGILTKDMYMLAMNFVMWWRHMFLRIFVCSF